MVTTRRQSMTLEHSVLPPANPPKRKRTDDVAPNPASIQPSSKRRKKVKSTAKITTNPVQTEISPAASQAKRGKKRTSPKAIKQKARKSKARGEKTSQIETSGTDLVGSRQGTECNITDDDDSTVYEATTHLRPAASQDVDDEEADSRYALGSKRKGKAKKRATSAPRRTAELKYAEDGLEENDKAAAVNDARNGALAQNEKAELQRFTSANNIISRDSNDGYKAESSRNFKAKAKQKGAVPTLGVPSRIVMFSVAEAIATLSLYRDGTMSVPVAVDPLSRQIYDPLKTGEYLCYPVKGTYHLGALGRYGIDAAPPLPFSLTVPLSEDSCVPAMQDEPTAEPSRHGLGFDNALAPRPNISSKARTNNYCFTFGRFRGRRMDSVPIEYLRTLFNGPEYHNDPKLQQAFADLYPKGLYESEEEQYKFQEGKHWGKRLDEVPPSYCWGLLRKKHEKNGAGLVGVMRKGREKLEKALEAWEKKQLDLTQD